MTYIGRFAPSPTGPLHYGSLIAALASYLDAKHAGGVWLLRIEDLDPPRESQRAPAEIMAQLKACGLDWDDDILFQSNRNTAYDAAIKVLEARDLIFPCTCPRKSTLGVYPGTCRHRRMADSDEPFALRFRVGKESLSINDGLFGEMAWDMTDDVGDFIIKRKDGLFAYQLAVVVDDNFQGVTRIVRGGDLLDSTPRQLALYRALGYQLPQYLHLPVLADTDGNKLSKQSHARPVEPADPPGLLRACLRDLGQDPQTGAGCVAELLSLAAAHWDQTRIPRRTRIEAPAAYQGRP